MSTYMVTLLADDLGPRIPAKIFGHLLEFIGRCVYDGVWVGEDSAVPNDDGLRLDTIEAFRQLQVPAVRLGGGFGEYYHWREGIGPRNQRRTTRNLFWGGYESNHFGTDEFLRWCAAIGAEPILQVNVATGSRQEALDWMEYCNASAPSELAAERSRNGHSEPYGVKYWQIGNENLILHTPEEYGREVRRFGTYMRQAEPDAKLIVRGTWNIATDFNQRLMEYLGDQLYLIDLLSLHCYTYPPPLSSPGESDTYQVVAGAELLERQVLRAAAAIHLYTAGKKQVGIIVDEYGTHHHEVAFGFPIRELPNRMEQPSFLRDAILVARVLHVFMRHADLVWMANLSTSINVLHTALKTAGPHLIRTPTYYVLDMLKEHANANSIRVISDAGTFKFGKGNEAHSLADPDLYSSGSPADADPDNGSQNALPNLDVVASATPDRRQIVVSIVNPRLDRAAETRLRLPGNAGYKPISATTLGGADPLHQNDFEQPHRISPQPIEISAGRDEWTLTCAPFSLTVLKLARAGS